MTIRTKLLVIIGVSLLCMAGLVYVTSRFTFIRGLEEIEEQQTEENIERALGSLSYIILDLETTTADWAAWDDTYAFMEDANSEYINSNLVDETFSTLRLNLMLFVHSSGQIVFGKAFDLENEEEVPISQDMLGHLSDDSLLLSQPGVHNFTSGIILLEKDPMLISSQPILTSEDKGPARGTLIFARYLDSEVINQLTQVTLSPVTMLTIEGALQPDSEEALAFLLQEGSVFVKPLNAQYISGYTVLEDIHSKPALLLRVDMPRDTYQLGEAAVSYYVLLILGISVLVIAVIMFIIQKQVLSRFTNLIRGINNITTSGDTAARVSVGGRDELSLVAGTINGMLGVLRESADELRESEDRYRDLFENATDLIMSVSVDGHFIYVNEAWRRTLEYSEEDVANLSLWDIIHPDSVNSFKDVFQRIISGESVGDVETVFVTKGGESVVIEGNASCRFEEGKAVAVRGILRDITARKQAEQKLKEMYEHERELRQQLEEETRKRLEFTRALVHELKTPITPVLAAAELLLEEIKEKRLMKLVQSINRSASNLNQRIDELLDLARGEIDMLHVELESVDPLLLLQEIGYEMSLVALNNKQTLNLELPSSLSTLMADRQRLQQVVLNLLNNAFKFTPEGGSIILRAREDDANLIIEVQDTGPGIDKEDQERLFQPYFRRREDRERLSGLGLGLALSKRLVELHRGRIWVKSVRGKGSIFGFSLPLEAAGQKEGETRSGGQS
jgi:PAS domain S-box-containing protein